MSDTDVRVRFAPSPTGALHIGGARTAYFNWLFARQQKGTFVLRIDDTDTARSTEESYQQILQSLRWLGIDWDEGPDAGGANGPYRQSERLAVYQREFDKLRQSDRVYPCFCTLEELATDRERAQSLGETPRYSGRCRQLARAEQDARMAAGDRPAFRLRSPREGTTVVHDLIRGAVSFNNVEIDDFIVWKADGTPTYHFASCVDDVTMQITHIVRAEEHLSNTPRHIMLFQTLGAKTPVFAHVPMILAPDRSKLSKRHGATSVQEYRDAGILPEAMMNYLLLLGFAPGDDREIVSREEAIELFDLSRVAKHAAVYDAKKLEWLNGHYLRHRNPDQLLSEIWPELQKRGWVQLSETREHTAWVKNVVQVAQERARSLLDLVETLTYYFEPVESFEAKGVKKHFSSPAVAERLERVATLLVDVKPFLSPDIESLYRALAQDWGIKSGDLIHPTRLAISGTTVGPSLFDLMALLGLDQCQDRMRFAANRVRSGTLPLAVS